MTSPFSHLYALEDRLDRERGRLALAAGPGKRRANERAFREHEIRMVQKEIEAEKAFLAARGHTVVEVSEMTDDELLAELRA